MNDAADVAKALEASGFTVIRRENASLREMHLALREFGDRLGRQSTGLFYFAGHGLQVRGRNYLLPVDADIAREDEVAFAGPRAGRGDGEARLGEEPGEHRDPRRVPQQSVRQPPAAQRRRASRRSTHRPAR